MREPVAILAASAHEAALVRRLLRTVHTSPCSAGYLWQGYLQEQQVVLLQCGMGALRAVPAVHWLCQHAQPAGVLSVGFAGGLQETLRTGDALLSTAILSEETHATLLRPDPRLAHIAAMAVAQTAVVSHAGPLLSTTTVVTQAAVKRAAGRLSGALAIDMESYSVGQTTASYQLPFMVLRTIFDPANEDFTFPASACTTVTGSLQPLRLARCLALQPQLCLKFPHWGWAAWIAGRHLQQWVQHFFLLLRRGA